MRSQGPIRRFHRGEVSRGQGRWKLRVTVPLVASVVGLGVMNTAALATPPHPRYVVVCSDGAQYESVDARAVDPGGKDVAVQNFSTKTPLGLTCELVAL